MSETVVVKQLDGAAAAVTTVKEETAHQSDTSAGSSLETTARTLPTSAKLKPSSSSQEEGVLRDVLDELDRERSKRAELEAQIRGLTDKLTMNEILRKSSTPLANKDNTASSDKARIGSPTTLSTPEDDSNVTRRQFLSLQYQVKGYQQLVDALTSGKPAIAKAAASLSQDHDNNSATDDPPACTIPLHALRLLEVVPWEAHEHIFAVETLLEWQYYVDAKHTWQSHLKLFPSLSSLPIVRPEPPPSGPPPRHRKAAPSKDRTLLEFLAGSTHGDDDRRHRSKPVPTPHAHGTLTDETVTRVYNIEAGYPLPPLEEGTWEWIGGWRVAVKPARGGSVLSLASSSGSKDEDTPPAHAAASVSARHLDCDAEGWSYVSDVHHFAESPELVWDSPVDYRHEDDTTADSENPPINFPQRRFRRRKWIRRRMMVDYPYASERTKQYLKVLAENARLTVTLDKVSDQLVETKTRLTESEAELMQARSELILKDSLLHESNLSSVAPSLSVSSDHHDTRKHDFLPKSDAVKDFGSKITQWVQLSTSGSSRKGSEDLTTVVSNVENSTDLSLENGESSGDLSDAQQFGRFDWKKIGRGALLERMGKGQIGGSSATTSGSHANPTKLRENSLHNTPAASIPEDTEQPDSALDGSHTSQK